MRIHKHRKQGKSWQRKASRRQNGSKNQQKAYRKVAHYQQYEKNVRQEHPHQTSRALVSDALTAVYVFEDLIISNMTKRPRAKKDAADRFLPNGAKAKAGLNRAILSSAWGQVVAFTRYKALRQGKLVVMVPFRTSSQECAMCTFTSPDNRKSQADFVCQRCGHQDNTDHNAAVVIQRRGIQKLLSGESLTKPHKTTRIFRKLGPERSEVTPGKTDIRHAKPKARTHTSQNQALPRGTKETPA